jgi:hypothetical protein
MACLQKLDAGRAAPVTKHEQTRKPPKGGFTTSSEIDIAYGPLTLSAFIIKSNYDAHNFPGCEGRARGSGNEGRSSHLHVAVQLLPLKVSSYKNASWRLMVMAAQVMEPGESNPQLMTGSMLPVICPNPDQSLPCQMPPLKKLANAALEFHAMPIHNSWPLKLPPPRAAHTGLPLLGADCVRFSNPFQRAPSKRFTTVELPPLTIAFAIQITSPLSSLLQPGADVTEVIAVENLPQVVPLNLAGTSEAVWLRAAQRISPAPRRAQLTTPPPPYVPEKTGSPESTSELQLLPSNTVAAKVWLVLLAAQMMLPASSLTQLGSEVTAADKSLQPDHAPLLNCYEN